MREAHRSTHSMEDNISGEDDPIDEQTASMIY